MTYPHDIILLMFSFGHFFFLFFYFLVLFLFLFACCAINSNMCIYFFFFVYDLYFISSFILFIFFLISRPASPAGIDMALRIVIRYFREAVGRGTARTWSTRFRRQYAAGLRVLNYWAPHPASPRWGRGDRIPLPLGEGRVRGGSD